MINKDFINFSRSIVTHDGYDFLFSSKNYFHYLTK